jgi:hypothetical protein
MAEGKGRHLHVDIDNLSVTEHEGEARPVAHIRRRFLRPKLNLAAVAKHFVSAKEWIEYLAMRYHRDPIQFHLLSERTGIFDPDELAAEIDFVLSVRSHRFWDFRRNRPGQNVVIAFGWIPIEVDWETRSNAEGRFIWAISWRGLFGRVKKSMALYLIPPGLPHRAMQPGLHHSVILGD